MYYPKIDTLFDRGEDFNVDLTKPRRPEFTYIKNWLWMEKLDGSNISIIATRNSTSWRGRTPKSNFIPDIKNHLNLRVEAWNAQLQEVLGAHKLDSIEFFGEVYGPKIQSGGIYREDIGTKFYDVRVNENLWLDHDALVSYSELLDFEVPRHGYDSTSDLIGLVSNGFQTFEHAFDGTPRPAEGVVAKTYTPLYNNAGNRLIWKLKHSDFTHGS